jgi:hypothetical protein
MKYSSQHKQLIFDVFHSSLSELSKENRWVKLGDSLPWDEIEKIYNRRLNNAHGGAGNKPARMIRPSKERQGEEYRKKMAKDVGERNEVEATFGTGKRIYRANNIRAKLPDMGEAWTSACYFSKNVMKFLKELLHALTEMI